MSRAKPILRMAFCGADSGLSGEDDGGDEGGDEGATIPPLCRVRGDNYFLKY